MNTVSYSGILPQFHLDHILRLTDDTGIVQHAIYSIPNYHEGYCLDDNARALLMATMVYQKSKDKIALRLISRYLAYINYAQNPDGTFRNFMAFDRRFLDDVDILSRMRQKMLTWRRHAKYSLNPFHNSDNSVRSGVLQQPYWG